MPTKTAGIIGFGRFGALLASIIGDDFKVTVFDESSQACQLAEAAGYELGSPQEALSLDVCFYCVPVRTFEQTIKEHKPLIDASPETTIIDMLSVKLHPKHIFEKYIDASHEILLAHPMFGPDGVAAYGLANQKIVVDRFRAKDATLQFWLTYFERKGLRVIEMTADEHDRLAASSQALTHMIGRLFEACETEPTAIDALSTERLHELKTLVCKDNIEVFLGLQTLNPYCAEMHSKLASALKRVMETVKAGSKPID